METRMYKIEALQGNTVVYTEPGWGEDEAEALCGVRLALIHKGIALDGIRASLAKNIYDAYGLAEKKR